MSAGDVENLANLAPGWFADKGAEVVQLKQDTVGNGPRSETGSVGAANIILRYFSMVSADIS